MGFRNCFNTCYAKVLEDEGYNVEITPLDNAVMWNQLLMVKQTQWLVLGYQVHTEIYTKT